MIKRIKKVVKDNSHNAYDLGHFDTVWKNLSAFLLTKQ